METWKDGYQINDRSVFDNKDIEHPLDCLLEEYHQEQLKLLNIPPVVVSSSNICTDTNEECKHNCSGLCKERC